MILLLASALVFIGIHLGVAGTTLRDRCIAAIGEKAYGAAFSIASVAMLFWMVKAYQAADDVPTWGVAEWWKPLAIVLMLPAFLLFVCGVSTPNPTAVAQDRRIDEAPQGIVRVTRHPFLIAVALWALIHLVANGDVASLILFGSLAVVALLGTISIDAKRRRNLGPTRWDAFAARTSILPFAAIAAGRNSLDVAAIGYWRLGFSFLAYILMLGGHAHIIGVSPFPT